jgi:hypothetical protein
MRFTGQLTGVGRVSLRKPSGSAIAQTASHFVALRHRRVTGVSIPLPGNNPIVDADVGTRSSPAEGLLHDLVGLRRLPIGQALETLLPGIFQCLQQRLERLKVAFDCSCERCLDPVVSRDDGGVLPSHCRRSLRRSHSFADDALAPAAEPVVAGGALAKLGTKALVPALGGVAQRSEAVGEIGARLGHGVQQVTDEGTVIGMGLQQAQLCPKALEMGLPEALGEGVDRRLRLFYGLALVLVEEGQQRFGQAREVPVGDARLVAEGVTPAMVDRAVDPARVIGIHKGTGAVVDGLTGDRHIVGVHHAVDEADAEPLGNEVRLCGDDGVEQRPVGAFLVRRFRIVAGDDIVREDPQGLRVATRGEVFEGPDPARGCAPPV